MSPRENETIQGTLATKIMACGVSNIYAYSIINSHLHISDFSLACYQQCLMQEQLRGRTLQKLKQFYWHDFTKA